MKFIVGADKNFEELLKQSVACLTDLKYDYEIYDLGGLGYGKLVDVPQGDFTRKEGIVRCLFKPLMILDALQDDEEEWIIYIDADVHVKERIDEIRGDYDIGVTRRRPNEVNRYKDNPRVGKYNAGVIFFHNTFTTEKFVREWEHLARVTGIEQKAFNLMLGKTKAQIKEFSTNIYNNYYFDGTHGKVIHYKSDTKNRTGLKYKKD